MARPWTVLLMAIAVAILFGALSRVWAVDDDLVRVGPSGLEICMARPPATPGGAMGEVECRPDPNVALPGDIVALGWIVLFGGFASAAACAFCAQRLAREQPVPFGLALVATAITALAMIAFEVRLLTIEANLSIGTGFPIGLGGAIAALVALALLRRVVERG